ncbi:MAG TPA: S1/P1 Nuclease, partial [Candidatus Angelobacter sp.]|nr:S1/P1 Nuclease [Candidatus Angelobacter sp.]
MKAITPGNSEQFSEDQLYTRSFHSLGVRDLLDARDQFHLHLVHKKNVFATAVGFYLIRNDDPDAGDHAKTAIAAKKRGTYGERTLENSTVRPWSWPCVLAFVTHWQDMSDLRKHPESVGPPFLYLEDGRIVPVCVVKANQSTLPARTVNSSKLLATALEGGSPIFVEAQGQR